MPPEESGLNARIWRSNQSGDLRGGGKGCRSFGPARLVPRFSAGVYIRGRRIATLVSGALDAGVHAVNWDGRDNSDRGQASGVYLVLLEAGPVRLTRRLTMVQ